MKKIKPSKKQTDFLSWEMGVLFHFGIRSFFPKHKDWDNKPMPVEAFNPEKLDCGQWIRTAKEIGAKYAVFVCKHHDGFANWPSDYTEYSVAKTPYKNGKGDIVREFIDACRKYDLKVGLYYSPAQWGDSAYDFSKNNDYDNYFINQIGELLTNYGKIDYIWFDGSGSEGHSYDKVRIIAAIRKMQPEICIFNMWDPDTRWVGNEDGYADMPNLNTVYDIDFSVNTTEKEKLGNQLFLPAECDFKLRNTWFDSEEDDSTVKEVDELVGIYEMSVGRGANFLINIGPNRHGLLNDADISRAEAFGKRIREIYGKALDFSDLEAEKDLLNCYSIVHENMYLSKENEIIKTPLVNRVVLCEDITDGESVSSFRIYANLPGSKNKKICVYNGNTIGHKAICVFSTIRTPKITVEIATYNGPYRLLNMKAYYAK